MHCRANTHCTCMNCFETKLHVTCASQCIFNLILPRLQASISPASYRLSALRVGQYPRHDINNAVLNTVVLDRQRKQTFVKLGAMPGANRLRPPAQHPSLLPYAKEYETLTCTTI